MLRSLAPVLLLVAAALPAQRTPLAPGTWAMRNVHLVPMTRDTVIRNAAVLIRDGRIVAAGPAAGVRLPAGTRIIDGRGGYLMPGLGDMHTHLTSDDRIADSLGRYEMGIFLANGITTVRLLIGTQAQLALREAIRAGRVTGPNLWLATPQFAGRRDANTVVAATPEQARAGVDSVAGMGFDFLKITNDITLPVYDAIMAQAKLRGMRVDGHVNPGVGVEHAAASGQHMQHLDGWFEAALADSAPMKISLTQDGVFNLRTWESIDHIDLQKIAPLAGRVARSGVWITPTLALFNVAFAAGETDEEIRARPDWQLIPPNYRDLALRSRASYWRPAAEAARTPARRKLYVDFRNAVAKALSDSGAKLLAGSDAPDWFMSAGYTLHRELAALVQAGLTPYQALVTATRNPAEFLGVSKEWGTIETGKRADLLLLEANPLTGIANTTGIRGVAVGGTWFERSQLDSMIRVAASKINPGT